MNQTSVKTFTIGRLAKQADVGIDTIRFYERRGLLPPPSRTSSGYRLYGEDTITRLRFVRRAKALGFTLDEIENLLQLQDQGGPKAEVKALTAQKMAESDEKIGDLTRMRAVLHDLSKQCSGRGNVATCPILEAIAEAPIDDAADDEEISA